jgi:hypothetical protein
LAKGLLAGVAVILGLGLFASLIVLGVAAIFALTRPVVDASEQFLARLGQGRVAEAYASLADGLRAQQDEATFSGAVKQLGLVDYSSVAWHNREISNQEAIAEGTVTTKNGRTKSVSIQLIREGQEWRVVGVRFGGVELVRFEDAPRVPPKAELERIATGTLLEFNHAVQARDFTDFYGVLSDVWKEQTTPQQLQMTFREFLDKNVDIGTIQEVKPQLARPAAVSDQGILAIAGEYPSQPRPVQFELEYTRERGAWRLMGISVNVGRGEALPPLQ